MTERQTVSAVCRQCIRFLLPVAAFLVTGAPSATAQNFRVPGTDYDIVLNATEQPNTAFSEPLLAAIATWLSKEFGLPTIDRYPEVQLRSAGAITALRYKGQLPHAPHEVVRDVAPPTSQTNETIAIYVDHSHMIYLAEGWTGGTAADLSVLVHEMVHHFQNILGLKYECPQEREKLAYEAQDRWLRMFNHSLEENFELDGFSLLGKTRCFY
jgi:hypothetical protein